MKEENICKCGNKECLGFILLHEKELKELEKIKDTMHKEHGKVEFNLKRSPSSGEMYTKFYELHVIKDLIKS
jgi:hypothetical protein